MHRLLHRQLRKHLSVEDEVPEPLKAFIAAVGDAYEDFDSERALLERSTELSSKELSEATDKARLAAEELRESQALFKTVLDNMPAVMFVRDLDERYQLINRTYEDVYGVSRDTVQGQTLKDVFPKAEADEYGAHDQEAIDKGEPIVKEIRIEHGGEERIYSSIKFPIFDASGAPVAVGGIETDITVEKRAQQELHEREARQRAILETAPVGVTIVLGDGTFKFANTRMAEMVGLPQDQLLGQSARDFYVDPKEREVIRKRLGEEGSLYDLEVQMKRADGSAFWGLLSLVRTEEEGEPSYYGWMYDITKRKKAESRFSALLESAPDATVIVDRSGEIALINQQTERLFGFSAEEVIGQKVEALIPERYRKHHPQHRNGFFENTGVRPMGVGLELYGQAKDGHEFPIEISLSPIETDEGTLVAASVRDVTERKQAEDELRESEARFRDLLESSPVGVTIARASDGRLQYVNPRFVEMFRSDEESVIGSGGASYFADPAVREETIERFQRDGFVRDSLAEMKRTDGSLFWALLTFLPTEYQGEPARLGWLYDIDDRKRAEEAARKRENQLRTVLDTMPAGLYLANAELELEVFNDQLSELYGFPEGLAEEGRPLTEQIRWLASQRDRKEGEVDRLVEEGAKALKSGKRTTVEQHPPSGRVVQVDFGPARDGGVCGIVTDITERKKAEAAARKRESQLRTVLDNIPAGMYLANSELELEVFNDQFSELYGLPEGMVKEGTTLPDLIRWLASQGNYGDVEIDALVEERSRSLKSGEVATREQYPPSGLVIQLTYGPAQGEGVCGVVTDITERKKGEEELRQAKDSAEKALGDLKAAQVQLVQSEKMASLGQLTAGIAHEIKNPLNFVNNFAETSVELLEDLKDISGPALETLEEDDRDEAEDLIETLAKDLGTIAHHGQRADSIVKNMLLHSRGQGSERVPTDLNALVEEGMNLAYHGERARDRGFQVELEPDFDASVGKMTVVPQDIMRVLVNLVGNAFYATKKRREQSGNGYKPVVRVSTRAVDDGVELRVRDNGTGMPKEVREKLFTPFFTTKPTGEGTGLGLSISYDIVVQNHGGRMDVDSREGEFTEFVIRLPRAAATDRGGKA